MIAVVLAMTVVNRVLLLIAQVTTSQFITFALFLGFHMEGHSKILQPVVHQVNGCWILGCSVQVMHHCMGT
jgi:hypothetical protein